MSKAELVDRLRFEGFDTNEDEHGADFYYALKVKVEDGQFTKDEMDIDDVNRQNGNDTFSPYSPKVLIY